MMNTSGSSTTQKSSVDLKKQLVDELEKNKIVDEFFSKKTVHSQLIQRSEGLLKLLIS